jgi:hypothetical protein
MLPHLKRLFLDTEFTGLTQNTTLISMAIVAESGEEFYAEFTDYDTSQVSDWVYENVIKQRFLDNTNQTNDLAKYHILGTRSQVTAGLRTWLGQFSPTGNSESFLQIWADVPHYDWVLFCELFGGALHVPKSIHYMPMDIATMLFAKGLDIDLERSKISDSPATLVGLCLHSALYDAHVIKNIFKKIYNNE